ncbi:GmrSD restriction endonuclease domain-containing protein [Sphingomonas sp. 22R3R2A-7]|uniref:GmrSD restriction endonuclease domain-containing protein n=1 Tax=Sphingomonas sp. 22R3R2A-7 TaxID=3050230 RepID=UPI002FE19320
MAKMSSNLDAMIPRSDFAIQDARTSRVQSLDTFEKVTLRDLAGDSNFVYKLLRKPDFQRETTQWTPGQVAILVESFINGELIPAVILWRSSSNIFVIDGGHRLSALLAWANDDYGDGPLSYQFFNRSISNEQKRMADRTRREVASRVGTYQHFATRLSAQSADPDEASQTRQMNFATRGIQVQWITGDADKAESSFFKINTQGSALDETESLILSNRRKAPALVARAVVRASTGHKYWSNFDPNIQEKVQSSAQTVHRALFAPEIDNPVKTIDLPIAGSSSTGQALQLLIALAEIVDGDRRSVDKFDDDMDGSQTLLLLKSLERVFLRMVGNQTSSLGLHPLVWFYTAQGRHYEPLFLAITNIISEKLRNNQSEWFHSFTSHRANIETFLVENKVVITLLISALGSKSRVNGAKSALTTIFEASQSGQELSINLLADKMGLQSRLYSIQQKPGVSFSDEARSSAFVRESLRAALKCPICKSFMDTTKSASYDHIIRKEDGGNGGTDNCQITHPFCNSGVKERENSRAVATVGELSSQQE